MTARDRLLWLKFQRRAASLQPDVAADLLRAWAAIRESLSDAELARLIASGQIDQIIDDALLDRAFIPLRARLRKAIEKGFDATVKDLPKAGKVDGTIAVAFDTLNPKVIEAVRQLETRVITDLKDDVKETVRAFVENGLRDGRAPRSIARELRGMIGLSPDQLEQVQNFRDALEGKNGRSVTDYTLRNKTVDRLLAKGPLTEEQIDRYTDVYRKARIAQNANTISHTATLDSYKLGQQLSWEDARANGVIPPGYELWKTWVQIDRPTKREEHIPLNGETVPFDQPYSNGQMIPGEDDYNCACISRVTMRKAA
jgi:hypothetical protein